MIHCNLLCRHKGKTLIDVDFNEKQSLTFKVLEGKHARAAPDLIPDEMVELFLEELSEF